MNISLAENQLAEKIRGCWLGKAIGGTLGQPYEGNPGPLDLNFYDPVPGQMLPNDDLDLQLVWLHHLRATQARTVTPELLAQAWSRHVQFPWDEYGICLRNGAYGLRDYRIGAFDNWFSECMGAAIRSELWACLAAGEPERAAGFAWADAACDHAGDGIWAEVFLAALEALAFTVNDPVAFSLLDRALTFIPNTCRVHRAITDTRLWWSETHDWRQVRARVLSRHGHTNFTDVAQNLAFTVLGWLAGGGDFGRSICIAVNCGQDTDCTGATLGALLGILVPQAIPDRWRQPIGEQIKLWPTIVGIQPPATLSELTEWTLAARTALLQASPKIGPVLPREPAQLEDSPIRIQAELAWAQDMAWPCLSSPEKITLPGHWLKRRREDFAAPVMLLRFGFELSTPQAVCVLACGATSTAVWVDGAVPPQMPPERCCQYTSIAAPSFPRGGNGHFKTPQLATGRHELVVAWARPSEDEWTDLVVGIGTSAEMQWIPQTLVMAAPEGPGRK